MEIVKHRAGNEEIGGSVMEAMVANAWELLKMMRIHVLNPNELTSRLHVTLLKAQPSEFTWENEEDDYGWGELCDRTILKIPFLHTTMLDSCNAGTIADIIVCAIAEAKK